MTAAEINEIIEEATNEKEKESKFDIVKNEIKKSWWKYLLVAGASTASFLVGYVFGSQSDDFDNFEEETDEPDVIADAEE